LKRLSLYCLLVFSFFAPFDSEAIAKIFNGAVLKIEKPSDEAKN